MAGISLFKWLSKDIYTIGYIFLLNLIHQNKRKLFKFNAQQKTLAVSALWHGLYLGYFVAFFHWALLLQVSQ